MGSVLYDGNSRPSINFHTKMMFFYLNICLKRFSLLTWQDEQCILRRVCVTWVLCDLVGCSTVVPCVWCFILRRLSYSAFAIIIPLPITKVAHVRLEMTCRLFMFATTALTNSCRWFILASTFHLCEDVLGVKTCEWLWGVPDWLKFLRAFFIKSQSVQLSLL